MPALSSLSFGLGILLELRVKVSIETEFWKFERRFSPLPILRRQLSRPPQMKPPFRWMGPHLGLESEIHLAAGGQRLRLMEDVDPYNINQRNSVPRCLFHADRWLCPYSPQLTRSQKITIFSYHFYCFLNSLDEMTWVRIPPVTAFNFSTQESMEKAEASCVRPRLYIGPLLGLFCAFSHTRLQALW